MGAGPMSKIRTNGAYNWYLKAKRDDLVLPPLRMFCRPRDTWELFPGERYCRVRGCENRNRFASVGNLRVHIREKHHLELEPIPEQMVMYAPWVLKAYRFYLEILDDSGGILPELPMISEFQEILDGRRMEEMVRAMGLSVPCTRCGQKEVWTFDECCVQRGYGKCLHFALFRPVDSWLSQIEDQLHDGDIEYFLIQAEMNRDRIARQDEERFQAELNRRRIEMERLDEETRRRGEDAEPKDTEPKDAEPDDAVPVNAGPEESKSEIAERDCDEPKKS